MKTSFSKKTGRSKVVLPSLLLWAISSGSLLAQTSISIDSNVDKSTIRIGDLVRYSVEIKYSPGITVESPGLAANLGAFEIRDYQVLNPQTVDGQNIERVEYVISTFDIGKFEIPPLTFRYTTEGDSTVHELKTRRITILVESLKPSEAGDIRDVKSPWLLPRDLRKTILLGSIAVAFVVLLAVLFYIWRRRKAGKGLLPQKVEPPRPAHEVAWDELQALKRSSLLAEGRIKEFYIEVSEIIRKYIGGRYFIVALELTTSELIENLRATNVDPEHEALIHSFLDRCDLVKFAKLRPTPAENGHAIETAFEIVEKTKLLYDRPDEPGAKADNGEEPGAETSEPPMELEKVEGSK